MPKQKDFKLYELDQYRRFSAGLFQNKSTKTYSKQLPHIHSELPSKRVTRARQSELKEHFSSSHGSSSGFSPGILLTFLMLAVCVPVATARTIKEDDFKSVDDLNFPEVYPPSLDHMLLFCKQDDHFVSPLHEQYSASRDSLRRTKRNVTSKLEKISTDLDSCASTPGLPKTAGFFKGSTKDYFTSPSPTVSPTNLTFTTQAAGTTSPLQEVIFTNPLNGNSTALNVSSIEISSYFNQTNNCLSDLVVPGGNCSINVTFTPTNSGLTNGSLTITSNFNDTDLITVSLSGLGYFPPTVSPSSLSFANQSIGTTSPPQNVTLFNPDNLDPLNISSIVASAGFNSTSSCGPILPLKSACVINVTFTPGIAGVITGNLTITSNATNSPQTVSLNGAGFFPYYPPVVSPLNLSFANQTVGTTSPPQNVTLTNPDYAALDISRIVASADFNSTSDCGSILPSNSSCVISVTFTPGIAGVITGNLTITSNATNSPQTVSLNGTAFSPYTPPVVSPTFIRFANQTVGTTSPPQNVTLINPGFAALNISSIVVSPDFNSMSGCGRILPSNSSCVISVTFTPGIAGVITGNLTITDNATTLISSQIVYLNGTGVPRIPATLNDSPVIDPAVVCCGRPVLLGPLAVPGVGPTTYAVVDKTGDVRCIIGQSGSQTFFKMNGRGTCTLVGTKDDIMSAPLTVIAP